jgi:leucyl aminopeptidase
MSQPSLPAEASIPIRLVSSADWVTFAASASRAAVTAAVAKFTAKPDQMLLIPDADGRLAEVVFAVADSVNPSAMPFRSLAARLPSGTYQLDRPFAEPVAARIALAWSLGAYRFDRYKQKTSAEAPPVLRTFGDGLGLSDPQASACALTRDLINTPANDMGPAEFESVARRIAGEYGAAVTVVAGDALLPAGYPAVHAVGRAAGPSRGPRMIEIAWGDETDPVVVVIGKGVVFDSGGLDIKPSAGMRLMKKDMGGAAHALALGSMVMSAGLRVRLILLIPVVENAISGDAMRPGDVLASRKGLSIEIGNTDAEGRLILADALARAGELNPALTVDLATLTGAARVALGPEIAPFYTDDDTLAGELDGAALVEEDPLWRMPLWAPYAPAIDSDIADVRNDADAWAQAGSMTAALFLKRFAPPGPWVHFDIFAWNGRGRPGYPVGAEVQAIRAVYSVLRNRYR